MKPKRLLIDVDKQFHTDLKSLASQKGISLKEYVTKLIILGLHEEYRVEKEKK